MSWLLGAVGYKLLVRPPSKKSTVAARGWSSWSPAGDPPNLSLVDNFPLDIIHQLVWLLSGSTQPLTLSCWVPVTGSASDWSNCQGCFGTTQPTVIRPVHNGRSCLSSFSLPPTPWLWTVTVLYCRTYRSRST
jgi:hypothetical protein